MEDKKKIFIIPTAEVIDFTNDDIVTTSGGEWNLDDNHEDFGGLGA